MVNVKWRLIFYVMVFICEDFFFNVLNITVISLLFKFYRLYLSDEE